MCKQELEQIKLLRKNNADDEALFCDIKISQQECKELEYEYMKEVLRRPCSISDTEKQRLRMISLSLTS